MAVVELLSYFCHFEGRDELIPMLLYCGFFTLILPLAMMLGGRFSGQPARLRPFSAGWFFGTAQ